MLGTWKFHKQSTYTCHLFSVLKEGSCFVSEFSGLLRFLSIIGKMFTGLTEVYWTFLVLVTQLPLLLLPPFFTTFSLFAVAFLLFIKLCFYSLFCLISIRVLLYFCSLMLQRCLFVFYGYGHPREECHSWEYRSTCDLAAGSAGPAVRAQARPSSSLPARGSRALA